MQLLSRDYSVGEIHGEHRTHGYRWVAAYIRINNGISISDNFVYKCFRYLGIRAETEHRPHYRPRKVRDRYPNLIFSTWETVDRPRQVIVSDMTAFRAGWLYFEVTFYFDVFTKEMLTWRLAERRDTFSGRTLSTEPKFVRERRAKAHETRDEPKMSTPENENSQKKEKMSTFENAEAEKILEMSTSKRLVN